MRGVTLYSKSVDTNFGVVPSFYNPWSGLCYKNLCLFFMVSFSISTKTSYTSTQAIVVRDCDVDWSDALNVELSSNWNDELDTEVIATWTAKEVVE